MTRLLVGEDDGRVFLLTVGGAGATAVSVVYVCTSAVVAIVSAAEIYHVFDLYLSLIKLGGILRSSRSKGEQAI